jgi:hypothetical protein
MLTRSQRRSSQPEKDASWVGQRLKAKLTPEKYDEICKRIDQMQYLETFVKMIGLAEKSGVSKAKLFAFAPHLASQSRPLPLPPPTPPPSPPPPTLPLQ